MVSRQAKVIILFLPIAALLMGAAEASPSVASQWMILIGVLLVSGVVFGLLALFGIAVLGGIAYYVILIGTFVTMLVLSHGVVSALLEVIGPGSNLWWLSGPIATIGIFVPIGKAYMNHAPENLEDADSWMDKIRAYVPWVFVVLCVPMMFFSLSSSTHGTGSTILNFFTSVAITGVLLGWIFVFLHGGITALLGSVALLIHTAANGGPIDLMLFFETLVGVIDEFFSVHLPAVAALVWSLLSAAYSVFRFMAER